MILQVNIATLTVAVKSGIAPACGCVAIVNMIKFVYRNKLTCGDGCLGVQ